MTSLAPSERKELIQNAINFLTPKEGDDIRALFMAAFCHLSSLPGDRLVQVLQRHPLGGNKHHAYFQRQRALPLTRARSFGETSTTGTFVKRGAVTSGRDISSIFMPMENIVDNADAGVTGDETGKTSPSVDGAAASVEETHGGNHTTKGSENESGRVTTDLHLVHKGGEEPDAGGNEPMLDGTTGDAHDAQDSPFTTKEEVEPKTTENELTLNKKTEHILEKIPNDVGRAHSSATCRKENDHT